MGNKEKLFSELWMAGMMGWNLDRPIPEPEDWKKKSTISREERKKRTKDKKKAKKQRKKK